MHLLKQNSWVCLQDFTNEFFSFRVVLKVKKRKGKRKHLRCSWFSENVAQHSVYFFYFVELHLEVVRVVMSYRKRRWRSKRCCISRPGCMTGGLQRWCFKWSVPAKVGEQKEKKLSAITVFRWKVHLWRVSLRSTRCYCNRHPQTGHLHSQRREHPGPAGTERASRPELRKLASSALLLTGLLFWCRKCWTISRKKETWASLKAYPDSWCHAGLFGCFFSWPFDK